MQVLTSYSNGEKGGPESTQNLQRRAGGYRANYHRLHQLYRAARRKNGGNQDLCHSQPETIFFFLRQGTKEQATERKSQASRVKNVWDRSRTLNQKSQTETTLVFSVRQYGRRDRLLLCRGASGSAQVTHKVLDGCLEGIDASISCLLARRMSSERRGEIILSLAGNR